MGMEVVGFSDSDKNEVYVPAVQLWLQGSDLDIDKLYIMMFEISKRGKLQTFSKIQNKFKSARAAMDLVYPPGVDYEVSVMGGTEITLKDWNASVSFDGNKMIYNNADIFNKILKSGNRYVTFSNDLIKAIPEYQRKRFIKDLKKHSTSKLTKSQKQSALRNSVVHKILRLMEHPLNTIPAHKPISMEDLQIIASRSLLSKREKVMSSLNPLGKFIMQVQNMVGKDVIGITAVSLKVFFAMSAFVNQRVTQLRQAIIDNDVAKIDEFFKDITFMDKITGNLVTLANVNLDPLKDLSNKLGDDYELPVYVGDEKNLKKIVRSLSENSSKIDCAEAISQLLSAATDNAKELILSKINATADFADT